MAEGRPVRVGGAYIPQTGVKRGEVELSEHQLKTIESKSRVVVLDAPTGSGKTLAALARVVEHQRPAVFIYPTNALVEDQFNSIARLLEMIGYAPNCISESWDPGSVIRSDDRAVDLILATGDSLERIAGDHAKGTALERILTATDKRGRLRILLTNPDTLYMVNAGMYARSGLISDQLFKFQTIVVDEFHLYAGPTLARLMFMLNDFYSSPSPQVDLVFLSATHGDVIDLLKNTYPEADIIRATPLPEDGPSLRQIRHGCRVELRTQSTVLVEDDRLDEVAGDILRLYETPGPPGKDYHVKVLAIFSSVMFAISVARRVKDILSDRGLDADSIVVQNHGLIPRSARPSIERLSNAILIGTSSIEVGVDFDVPRLVMEAHDLASFLQRFGRGGRHGPCDCVLYVPDTMTLRLGRSEEWSYPDFIDQAKEAFRDMPSYADFVCSRHVRTILLAMALAASREHDIYHKRTEYNVAEACEYFKRLVKANGKISMGQKQLIDVIGGLDDVLVRSELNKRTVSALATNGLLRGSINNVLVMYPGWLVGAPQGEVVAEADIFDVFKMEGKLERAERHWQTIPRQLQMKYSVDDPVFVVRDFRRSPLPRVSAAADARARHNVSLFNRSETTIKCHDRLMTDVINDLLEGRNLVFLWNSLRRGTDFRIPRLYCEDGGGALVIGDWAIVAHYLCEKQRMEDTRHD
ncbi:MAG: type I-D CRISPR-associated helicase Cas3' [Candidatus Thorarchaeota archaeon]